MHPTIILSEALTATKYIEAYSRIMEKGCDVLEVIYVSVIRD